MGSCLINRKDAEIEFPSLGLGNALICVYVFPHYIFCSSFCFLRQLYLLPPPKKKKKEKKKEVFNDSVHMSQTHWAQTWSDWLFYTN